MVGLRFDKVARGSIVHPAAAVLRKVYIHDVTCSIVVAANVQKLVVPPEYNICILLLCSVMVVWGTR